MNNLARLQSIFSLPTRQAVDRCDDLARDFFGVRHLREQLSYLDGGSIDRWVVGMENDCVVLRAPVPAEFSSRVKELPPILVREPVFEGERLKSFVYADLPLAYTLASLGTSTDGLARGWVFKNRPDGARLEVVFADVSTTMTWPPSLGSRPRKFYLDEGFSVIVVDDDVREVVPSRSLRRLSPDGFAGIVFPRDDDRSLRPCDVSAVVLFQPDTSEPWLTFDLGPG